MTITFSATDEDWPVDMLVETMKMYRRSAADLAAAINQIQDGDLAQSKAAATAIKELRQAIQWAVDERQQLEKYNKTIAGASGPDALDLDAARDEIGRRLALLRGAGPG